MEAWMKTRAGLDDVEERKFKTWFLGRPAHSKVAIMIVLHKMIEDEFLWISG
jgi:hypothetical protein